MTQIAISKFSTCFNMKKILYHKNGYVFEKIKKMKNDKKKQQNTENIEQLQY